MASSSKPETARTWVLTQNALGLDRVMDLIGPMGARETGHVRHAVPLYILVITDPFSHMLWLQPITTKAPEEVYKKFVENFLLEEGAPQFILTDRGTEFKNEILRNLMEMLKIRLRFTPSYHPRGNYTERTDMVGIFSGIL